MQGKTEMMFRVLSFENSEGSFNNNAQSEKEKKKDLVVASGAANQMIK